MKTTLRSGQGRRSGYMLMEALFYIALLFLVIGAAYLAMYRCVDHSLVTRRATEDVAKALDVGERWRADIRATTAPITVDRNGREVVVVLPHSSGNVLYHFQDNVVSRKVLDGPWVRVLSGVASSDMSASPRTGVTPWVWELELAPRSKGAVKASRVRPLFTFVAVPAYKEAAQ